MTKVVEVDHKLMHDVTKLRPSQEVIEGSEKNRPLTELNLMLVTLAPLAKLPGRFLGDSRKNHILVRVDALRRNPNFINTDHHVLPKFKIQIFGHGIPSPSYHL